jgi:hypothetical protein
LKSFEVLCNILFNASFRVLFSAMAAQWHFVANIDEGGFGNVSLYANEVTVNRNFHVFRNLCPSVN